jgi:membrane protein implicated in regulation of membrane protease activity
VVGFYATRLFQQSGSGGLGFVLPAAGMAAAGGVLGAKLIGEIGSRLMPSEESFAVGKEDLLGLIGTVVYPVSGGMGRIHIYDAYGTLHDESARLLPDQTEDIGKGESVIVVDYDEASHCFLVESSPV